MPTTVQRCPNIHPMTCRSLLALALIPCAGLAWADGEKPTRFEGAVGLTSTYGPEYGGAARSGWGFRPAGFVRYGRITISGGGGFTTRRDDDVERGIAAELVNRNAWRVSLSGRWTGGRQESDSGALAGLGDIQGTLLARLRVQWRPPGPWHYALAISTDTLGRGGGWLGDLGAARQWVLGPDTRLQFATALSFGSDTHLQSWYGVTPEQSRRSGYPVYTPGNGLRDIGLGLTLRQELGPHWGSYVGAHASWQIGAAAKSPIVQQRLGGSLGAGLVWRF
jgi:outer membrane scaffolding protein for murein synthesis (MipA/OmpV family)